MQYSIEISFSHLFDVLILVAEKHISIDDKKKTETATSYCDPTNAFISFFVSIFTSNIYEWIFFRWIRSKNGFAMQSESHKTKATEKRMHLVLGL